jgi:hypothetical protein
MKEKLSRTKLMALSTADVNKIIRSEDSYGDSWKKRGGVGAFMMLARKWDRIENQVKNQGWDIFKAMKEDRSPEGLMDDIKDLRCYLLLVDDFINNRGEQNDS